MRHAISACFGLAALGIWCSQAVAEMPSELGAVTGKVVLVDFWASWCGPCRRSFPWMNEMLEQYGDDGLQIIGVNLDKDQSLAAAFLQETPASFNLVYDPEGSLAEQFEVTAMPMSFLLDADGDLISSHFGFRFADREEYEANISKALASASPDQ